MKLSSNQRMPWQPVLFQTVGGTHNDSANCSDGIHWIYTVLNDCVYDAKGISSEVLGLASIVTWMIVSVPQMVKNCRHIEGIEGISLMLILMWTVGDSANLVGSILTQQLPLQIYLAIYFVFADLILFTQFIYYNCHWKKKYKGYEPIPSTSSKSAHSASAPQMVLCVSGVVLMCVHHSLRVRDSLPYPAVIHNPAGRSLLATDVGTNINMFNNLKDKLGYAIGIVSSICYTFSRIGQMYTNYKRKSTDGLSVMMFVLAVLGNITYGLSIIVRQQDATYLLKHLPWLVGSLGVVFLDSALLCQFIYYGAKDDLNTLLKETVLIEPTDSGNDVEVRVSRRDHSLSIN